MIRFFDSHAHLTDGSLPDTEAVLAACLSAGVRRVLDAASDLEDSVLCIAHAQAYDCIHAGVGVHPHAALDTPLQEGMERLRELAGQNGVVAIGETGLDYHYDRDWREAQLQWFEAQLDLAGQTGLPIIVHDREAHGDTIDILRGHKGKVTGVIHCFSGSLEMARECMAMGYYISFSGSVTFKNARRLQEVAAGLPLDRILIETDSPYLAPEPIRKLRPNQPAHVVHVAQCIARLKNEDVLQVAETTYKNACALFGIREETE